MVEATAIEIVGAFQSAQALLPEYVQSAHDGTPSRAMLHQVNSIIRSQRAGWDKLANHVQTHFIGGRSRSTYYPYARSADLLDQTMTRNLPALELGSDLDLAFRWHQPFNGHDGMRFVFDQYPDAQHHGVVLQETNSGFVRQLEFEGLNVHIDTDGSVTIGTAMHWPGVWTAVGSDALGPGSVTRGSTVDWYLAGTRTSVMASVIDAQWELIATYQDVTLALGLELDPEAMAAGLEIVRD